MSPSPVQADTLLIHANLATMDPRHPEPFGILKNHTIAVSGNIITAIAPDETIHVGPDCTMVDVAGKWITPGLIDCHTHLVYAGNRVAEWEMRLQGVPYTEIAKRGGGILNSVKATRSASAEELYSQSLPRAKALSNEGVTTLEIKSGYGLNLADEIKMLRVAARLGKELPVSISTTLLAAHAIPPEYAGNSDGYVDFIINQIIPAVAAAKWAEAVDVFCEKIAFSVAQCERIWTAAQEHGLGVKGHVEQLSNLHGCEAMARHLPWSADHIEYLDEAGVAALALSGGVAVLLPGAYYFLREQQKPPVEQLRQAGVPLAVATDLNPGTSPFASIRLAMNMASVLFGLTPEEALAGATSEAARALRRHDKVGTIAVGKQADLLIWDIDHPAEIVCSLGVNRLQARMYQGKFTDAAA